MCSVTSEWTCETRDQPRRVQMPQQANRVGDARCAINLTLLLAMVGFKYIISAKLPELSYAPDDSRLHDSTTPRLR